MSRCLQEIAALSRRIATALFAAALSAAPFAAVAEPTQPSATPEAKGAAATGDPDRRICKTAAVTGTRLSKAKVCKTAREWDAQTAQTRQNLERNQGQGPIKSN